ncbi:hypothetical protein D3870_04870 [Noviherbaspirillum cavernae]|uniref:Copper chaperone PCu(A)C n=1 Tax=Noviherbaspirillum cavernae TaxID=2320862 RepID=A0A418WZD1_9BURK|nr:hypothetical protein [Noviherbaspirillum cavernae]RJG05443.1 hypothetical protein D3870_04870 [Noviherbaspirillum cavernae]
MKLFKHASVTVAVLAMSLTNIAAAADDHKGHNHDDKKGAEHAHDAKSVYGGVVSVVKDVNYELVTKPDTITLYVTDHGKPVDTKGASANLTILSSAEKSDVKLEPAGENKLQAKGSFKVQAGTKVAGNVKIGNQPAQSVKFSIK